MGSDEKTSQWHEEEAWVKRLLRDQELLRERIGHKQVMSLGTFLTMLDRDGMADFLIIYGKAAREGIADSNDVDFYFEAARIRDENDAQRHIQVDEEHEGVRFHAYGWPSGALLHKPARRRWLRIRTGTGRADLRRQRSLPRSSRRGR